VGSRASAHRDDAVTSPEAATLRVGITGLGRMGTPIARKLAQAGLLAGAHNRTAAKSEELAEELGVTAYRTPARLAEDVDVIVSCVADGAALSTLYRGDDGFLGALRPGTTAVDMSTIGPHAVRELAELVAARDCELVDAPVSGSVATAEAGELTIMAGGSPEAFGRLAPLFEAVGSAVFHVGPSGAGAAIKLAVNNVVYGLNQSIAESLVLAERAGVDRLLAYEIFASSAAAAPFVHYRREAFEHPGTVPAAMRMTLAGKDLDLILGLAESVGADLPQAAVNAALLRSASDAGLADADISAVAELLRATARER
jgi:3-hydroxyisobutyrate dehydrogenase/2-hydroxy-3-oxopropionate reductase